LIRIPGKCLHLDDDIEVEMTRGAEEEYWLPMLIKLFYRIL